MQRHVDAVQSAEPMLPGHFEFRGSANGKALRAFVALCLLITLVLLGGSASNKSSMLAGTDGWHAVLAPFRAPQPPVNHCPSGLPVAGRHCYFIAANGSDTNSGASESSPWMHAPGMPSCTANCAAHTPAPGEGFIFRGGDTWHYGDKAAIPYTGGTWAWFGGDWSGTAANCDTSDNPDAVRSSCIYVGVDKSWYSGARWTRPIMTGDNPASTTAVAKCIYPQVGANNQFLSVRNHGFVWFDNFEWTGMCSATQENAANNYLFRWNVYLNDQGGSNIPVQNIYSNMYAHGWTHLPFQCSHIGGQSVGICETNTFIVSGLMTTFGPGNVCDGGDSDPTGVICMAPPGPGYLVYDNVFANQAQMVVNGCHVWHDNLWFGYTFSGDGVAHGNQWECNSSAPQNDPNGHPQAPTTHNVFYNNVVGHNSAGTDGDVKIQFAVNSTYPWFVFNNVIYDQGRSNQLNWGGTGVTLPTGQQFFFNNTYEAATSGDVPSCYAGMTYVNNLIIAEGGTYFAGPGGCRGGNNIGMNHASAIKQGYMASHTGTSGNNSNTTCANDITPCAETSSGNPTVGAGANLLAYCNTLLASSDGTIQRAGAACKNGTSYACSYDTNTHSVNCPREALVARPATTAWDVGASQFATPQTQNGGTVPR